ncbi:hypothetical protein [Burkholderia ubonensis]|uniref:hypothetical protein n=1 Tax=Burkholderia ubonensis TaxID=101571 RepID=UPI000B151D14|nr:hypothetical protein [Burkholderia ubonensis]
MHPLTHSIAAFQSFVTTLNQNGIPDAYRAALTMLASVSNQDSPPTIPVSFPHTQLRAALEEARNRLPEVLDWISLSDSARRSGEAMLTPDLAQLVVDLVLAGEHSHAIVLQDPLCLVSSRLVRHGLHVEQHCVGSDTPERCIAITQAPTWLLSAEAPLWGESHARPIADSDGLRAFSDTLKPPRQEKIAIAVLPLIPGVSGGGRSKQLPYAAAEDLMAMLARFGSSISRLIALIPNSMLYRTGKAEEFRESLLTAGTVEAILELPGGATPLATHHYSVLILQRPHNDLCGRTVLAMRLQERATSGTRGRGRRIEVVTAPALAQRITRQCLDEKADDGQIVTLDRIKLARSLLPQTLLAEHELEDRDAGDNVKLGDVVQIIRPSVLKNGTRRPRARVTTASIVHAYPYVRYTMTEESPEYAMAEFKAHETASDLRQGDILIVAKGSVGALALVESSTNEPVFVPSSCLILRPNAPEHAAAIYLSLRSGDGTERLRRITTGSTVRNLRVADLSEVIIPSHSIEACSMASETLHAVSEKTRQIEQLERERASLLPAARPAND